MASYVRSIFAFIFPKCDLRLNQCFIIQEIFTWQLFWELIFWWSFCGHADQYNAIGVNCWRPLARVLFPSFYGFGADFEGLIFAVFWCSPLVAKSEKCHSGTNCVDSFYKLWSDKIIFIEKIKFTSFKPVETLQC